MTEQTKKEQVERAAKALVDAAKACADIGMPPMVASMELQRAMTALDEARRGR